jgi:hypothetical protein
MIKNIKTFEERCNTLLESRGIKGHAAADRFVSDFKAYMVYLNFKGVGNAENTLSLLEDDSNLTSSDILNTNFRSTLHDLISEKLRQDALFMELFIILLGNNGKGVGAGELALPLIIATYRFSNESDGVFDGDKKVEIKKNGASLKPVKTGLTDKGLVDILNKKYWNGTTPGMRDKKKFAQHLAEVKDASKYADYFQELYVGCNTQNLAKRVEDVYTNSELFNKEVGMFALAEYKRVDNWNNIMYIDTDKGVVVNIKNVNNIDNLGLKFTPKLARKKDTQAIADGYVNVTI